MAKRLASMAVMFLVLGNTVFGQAHPGGIAREVAMGGSQSGSQLVLNPFIIDDPAYMLLNPSYQMKYKDYVWTNIGGGTLQNITTGDNGYGRQNAGVNFSLSKDFTLGAVLSFDPSAANLVPPQLALFINQVQPGRAQVGLSAVDVFEVVAAYDLGALDLGFGFLYGWANRDTKNFPGPLAATSSSETEYSARVLGFRFGMDLDMGGGSAFDATGALRLDKATDNIRASNAGNAANNGEYSESATEIQINARLKLKMSNKVNFVPYAGFLTASGEPKQDAPPTGGTATTLSAKASALALAVGAGGEFHTTKFYLAGGLSYFMSRTKTEVTPTAAVGTTTSSTTVSAFPTFNLGGEWWFTDWLAGRLGYYRAFANTNTKTEFPSPINAPTAEQNVFAGSSLVTIGGYGGADNSLVTLGLGMKLGGFALDAVVSEEALRRGFGVIGAQDNINSFGYMTASYSFE